MEHLIAFFDMGGYAGFVWPSYGVAAVVMGGLFVAVWRGLRHDERVLARLQAATGGRRRARAAEESGSGGIDTGGARVADHAAAQATPDNGGPA